MINLYTTSHFDKKFARFLKQHPDLEETVSNKIDIFIQDPKHPTLRTHKLSGNLSEQWAFSITYEYRITFIWEDDNVYLTNVGTHDEVY